jgi:polar amino acid transport system ATP-binding protein
MTDVVLALRDVQVRRGNRTIVDRITMTVYRGELVALMGASGAGKTTVLRAIAGLEPFDEGTIDVAGIALRANGRPHGALARELHSRVSMVFQFHHLFAHLTALHNVWLAPVHVHQVPKADAEHRGRALLESLGVGLRADALPHELSGGEAQRVAIARALAVDPPLLLMDEPTASLDASRRSELAATLISLVAQGRTLIVATHDAEFARACAKRVVLMDNGRIVKDGFVGDAI